ncbi:MAG: HAMP domain-containing protein, partial [Gammaproteobacteria bacterium]
DHDQHLVMETPGMNSELHAQLFPTPVYTSQLPGSYKKVALPSGNIYILIAAKTHIGKQDKDIRYIQLALNTSYAQHILLHYLSNLAILLLCGVMIAALVGAFLAKKSLHSLQEIAHAAEQITIDQLHTRISPSSWPREFSRLGSAFNQMLCRIEHSFNRVSQFSADLAHELRTPINNLMGEAEIAISRDRSANEYKEVIQSSLEEYRRLTRMIDSLLFLARAENPNTRIERTKINVASLFETLCDFFEVAADEKGVRMVHEGEAMVYADAILLQRALNNLISNALRYTPSKGMITLSVVEDKQGVCIHVRDTGIGVAKEHLPCLTDRFYRAETEFSSSSSGNTGLGLAIVKSIMDLHEGGMEIVSELGRGMEVRLIFPVICFPT